MHSGRLIQVFIKGTVPPRYQTLGQGLPTRNPGLAPGRGRNFWIRPLFTEAV